MNLKNKLKVEVLVNSTIENVWKVWNSPDHIIKWCSGHPDWHTPKASNDLRVGGKLYTRMEAKDGSMGFDMYNTYDEIIENQWIKYHLEDGRICEVSFKKSKDGVIIEQLFDPESVNTPELQKEGWQNILNNFKDYLEKV